MATKAKSSVRKPRNAAPRKVAPKKRIVKDTTAPVLGEYNGHPLIVFNPNARYPQSLGVSKCRLILENIEAVKRFVRSEGTEV